MRRAPSIPMTTMSIRLAVQEKEWLIQLGQITGRTHTEYLREFIRGEIRNRLIEELARLKQVQELQVDQGEIEALDFLLDKLKQKLKPNEVRPGAWTGGRSFDQYLDSAQVGAEPDALPHTDSIDVHI